MEEQKKDTEQLILEAAIKEFSTKGLDGARTSSIAENAGVTHAMLHYYFRTKERLFKRIFEEKIKGLMQFVIAPIANGEGNLIEKVICGVETHFDMLLENRWLPVFIVNSMNSHPELYAELLENISDILNGVIATLQTEFDRAYEAGEIRRIDVRKLIGDIVSLNVFPFLSTPMFMRVAGFKPGEEDAFFAMRRQENMETILNRISL